MPPAQKGRRTSAPDAEEALREMAGDGMLTDNSEYSRNDPRGSTRTDRARWHLGKPGYLQPVMRTTSVSRPYYRVAGCALDPYY